MSLSSAMSLPSSSREEKIAMCSGLLFEAILIFVGNFLTIILFALEKKLRKKSLFLVVNMAFADMMLGAVSLPVFVYMGVGHPQLWTVTQDVLSFLGPFYDYFDLIFLQASLVSAVFISCERLYAVYWPLKHRTLSTRAYAIVITIIWTLTALTSAIYVLSANLISSRASSYFSVILFLMFIFILCGCNIGIWRKYQMRNISFEQQNRAAQNRRLTKTLLFVSAAAVLSWLPFLIVTAYLMGIHGIFVPVKVYYIVVILNYFNSLVNPIIYALRIPEFKQHLTVCCSILRVVDGMKSKYTGRSNDRTAASDVTSLPADLSHLQLASEQDEQDLVFNDTKL